MSWHRTEALGYVRQSADDPRIIEGVALPYSVMSAPTDLDGRGTIGREVTYPGAAKVSVEHWMARNDGGRMPFRPRHGERPNGVVEQLSDTSDGVLFRARIFDSPAGNDYLSEVAAGLNAVSVEMGAGTVPSIHKRDGTVVHREIKLHAIAGSDAPAYDGARIALRDMEKIAMDDEKISAPAPDPVPEPPRAPEPEVEKRDAVSHNTDLKPAERAAAEARTVAVIRPAIVTRAEAVYAPGNGNSFLRDLRDSRQGNGAAAERQARHDRQLTDIAVQMERVGDVLSAEIPGAYPNDYLPGLLTPRILKGRPMGGFYNRTPIADARPKIFAKVTTSTTVAVQSAEGANPAASDLATTAVTATPLLYGAETVVSRQVLDGGDPSGEAMIIQDMVEAYAQASEAIIKTAVEAGASASGSAITAATPYAGLQANVVAYQAARFKPATGQFVPPALYTTALAQADTTGRPFFTYINPVNSQATAEAGGASGNILGATEFLSWASTLNVVVTGRPEDYVIYESSIARFSYDAVTGPAGIRLGIWAYLVVGTRLGSLKVTAA